MSRHRVSQLIVISSLIRPSHLLGLHWRGNLTLKGVGDSWGEEREKEMRTTPLPSKNMYIIDEAWLFAGSDCEHADLTSTQVKQTVTGSAV